MYADRVTGSMERATKEVDRRREKQVKYNKKHNITPKQITKPHRDRIIEEIIEEKDSKKLDIDFAEMPPPKVKKHISLLEKEMKYEAEMLNFEQAAALRDKIREIKKYLDSTI